LSKKQTLARQNAEVSRADRGRRERGRCGGTRDRLHT